MPIDSLTDDGVSSNRYTHTHDRFIYNFEFAQFKVKIVENNFANMLLNFQMKFELSN